VYIKSSLSKIILSKTSGLSWLSYCCEWKPYSKGDDWLNMANFLALAPKDSLKNINEDINPTKFWHKIIIETL
jgi:hypothetical protein